MSLIVASARVTAGSTGVTIPANGCTTLATTGTGTFNLPAPVKGQWVELVQTTTSTAVRTVQTSSGVTIGLSATTLTFNAGAQAAVLRATSATRWDIVSNVNSVASS